MSKHPPIHTLKDRPIALFDSGVGGLTVLHAIEKALPHENLIYLGDIARSPYGNKSAETIKRYVSEIAATLMRDPIKMIIIACNTASAVALGSLIDAVDPTGVIPVLGVIGPSAHAALLSGASTQIRSAPPRIAVIGTEGTIHRGAYQRALTALDPTVEVIATPCPLFVPLVEEGLLEGPIPRLIAERYLADSLKFKPDSLILGCTHYPLLKATIQDIMGPEVRLIDSADPTAREAKAILEARGLCRSPDAAPRSIQFFVTDAPKRFQKIGERFLQQKMPNIKVVDVTVATDKKAQP